MSRIFGVPTLTKRKISIFRCFSPKGEFLKMPEASLIDGSKNLHQRAEKGIFQDELN
ncbi:MAG: hypothetical protein ABIJ37_04365 [Pseudomonadota bacterium]